MSIAVTDEQLALADSIRRWAKSAATIATVRALEATNGLPAGPEGTATASTVSAPAAHWADLTDLGVFSIAVPEADGGSGGTVADLAVALEQLAECLAPGPVLATALAGLLVAGHRDLRAGLATGTASVAVALHADGCGATRAADGGLRVSGTAKLVVCAGQATHLLLGARTDAGEAWFVIDSGHPGIELDQRKPVDFSRSLADISLTDVVVAAADVQPGLTTDRVRDLAATLAAAEAAGIASWCAQTAADYARTRHQFGRAIGSFQSIKHLCAGMLCRAEFATAAAWDAATAASQAPDQLPLAAAAAAAVALDAAVENAKDCIQVLGGIGFTWEHDAHLYLRRALSLRHLLGGGAAWRIRAAGLALAGARRDRGGADRPGDSAGEGVRAHARAEAERIAGLPEDQRRAALADAGYAVPHWPAPYGRAASPAEQLVIDEELSRAGLARPDIFIGGWAIPPILGHGSAAQAERFAGPTMRGEITWCQLFSEPEAGSDLAGLRTRAVRADGGWKLTGQKVWTSLARQADWAICLARTDPDAPKHKGITFFLVAMNSPGIDIRPLREITGLAMFNEVFLDDVFVPDDCVVGAPGDGWKAARTTLASERVAIGAGSALSEEVEALLATAGGSGDPMALDQVGARLAEGLALSVMDDRMTEAVLRGADPGFSSAVRKLLGVAHRQAVAETALTLSGPNGAVADSGAVHQFLLSRCLSIAGGTSQILLSLVAERMLGLPRDEVR